MPQPNHATDSPLRALAPCHPALQLGCVQERCRTHADGMEIFLPGVPPETAVLLPRICQPPHRAVLSGTRNRIRPVALPLHGDGLDGLEPLTSAFGSVEIGPLLDEAPRGQRGACQRMRPVGRDPVVVNWCCQLVLRICPRRRAAWTRTASIMPKHGFLDSRVLVRRQPPPGARICARDQSGSDTAHETS